VLKASGCSAMVVDVLLEFFECSTVDGRHKNDCRVSTQYIDEPPMIYSENIDADAPVDMLFVC
jgi:hypothetical protein